MVRAGLSCLSSDEFVRDDVCVFWFLISLLIDLFFTLLLYGPVYIEYDLQ